MQETQPKPNDDLQLEKNEKALPITHLEKDELQSEKNDKVLPISHTNLINVKRGASLKGRIAIERV